MRTAAAGTYLDAILAQKRTEVEERFASCDLAELRRRAEARSEQVSLSTALKRDGVQVIAEIKRKSPSKGELRAELDPVKYAEAYASGGAAAISVLTDRQFFGGSLQDLRDVHLSPRRGSGLVILQKDFIIDERQVIEAAASGADAILLIVAALEPAQLASLKGAADDIGLEAVVEVHDEAELQVAVRCEAGIIGVNSRDLRSFKTELSVAERLLPLAPPDVVRIAESGIATRADVERVAAAGADAVLVGESLMLADDPGHAIRELRGC